MFRINESVGGIIALVTGTLVVLLGGRDVLLETLLLLMVLDFVCGVLQAGVEHQLNSSCCFKGIVKKLGYLVMVSLAVALDNVTQLPGGVIHTMVTAFLIANEGLSVLEHLAKLGVPIPEDLIRRLTKMREDNNPQDPKPDETHKSQGNQTNGQPL